MREKWHSRSRKYPNEELEWQKQRHSLLRCRDCGKRFSERHGTIFFDSRLPKEKTLSVMEHIAEGVGVRKTGRLTKVNSATVSRLTKLAGEHAEHKLVLEVVNGKRTKANTKKVSSEHSQTLGRQASAFDNQR